MGTPTGVLASAGMPSPSPPQQQELKEVQPKVEETQQQKRNTSLSRIVPVPVPFPMVTGPVGLNKSRKKVSLVSWQVSLIVLTFTTCETSPDLNANGGNTKTPAATLL